MKRVSRAMIERYCRRYNHNSTVASAIKLDTGVAIHEEQIARIRGSMSKPRSAHDGYSGSGKPLEPIGDAKQAIHEDMMRKGCDDLLHALVREHAYAFQAIPAVVPEFSNTDLRCLFPVRSADGMLSA